MEVFMGGSSVTNKLLNYIADRCPSLKALRLVSCYSPGLSEGFIKMTRNCPLLEDIVLVRCPSIGCDVYDLISDTCASLKRAGQYRRRMSFPLPWSAFMSVVPPGSSSTEVHDCKLSVPGSGQSHSNLKNHAIVNQFVDDLDHEEWRWYWQKVQEAMVVEFEAQNSGTESPEVVVQVMGVTQVIIEEFSITESEVIVQEIS